MIETVLKTEMYNLFAMPLNYFLLREGKEKRGVEEQKHGNIKWKTNSRQGKKDIFIVFKFNSLT